MASAIPKEYVRTEYSYISVSKDANDVFSGKTGISAGSNTHVDVGTLNIVNNFFANKNCLSSV